MPFYSYKCLECDHDFDSLRKIDDRHQPATEPCPSCGVTGKVELRIVGAPGLGDALRLGVKGYGVDSEFKEVLQRIHKNSPGSKLDQTSTICKL